MTRPRSRCFIEAEALRREIGAGVLRRTTVLTNRFNEAAALRRGNRKPLTSGIRRSGPRPLRSCGSSPWKSRVAPLVLSLRRPRPAFTRPRLFAAETGALSNSLWTKVFSAALRAVFRFSDSSPAWLSGDTRPPSFDSFDFQRTSASASALLGFPLTTSALPRLPRQTHNHRLTLRATGHGFPRLMTLNFTPSAGPRSSITT